MLSDYAKSLGLKERDYIYQSTFLDKDTGLKENNLNYLIGDTLINNPNTSYNYIDFGVFEGTFIHKYSLAVHNIAKGDRKRLGRWDIAKKIIEEMNKDNKYDKPQDDEVVVHLRLGDIFLSKYRNISNQYFSSNIKRNIIKEILKFKLKKVTIVTVSCTARTTLEEANESNKKSVIELKKFISELENINLNVKIKSSGADVDSDFIYKCYAKNLVITGSSSYGRSAKILNQMIVKKKYIKNHTFYI